MTPMTRIRSSRKVWRRALAVALAGATTGACLPAAAVEPIGDGVAPTFDEAYYATLDYYGNLTEGSVVKSYTLNGATKLTDRGTYDEVVNLTDGTVPTTQNGVTTFQFDPDSAPKHFYFEGKTAQPFQDLPWTLSLHYSLNGVPTRAEDLAGKTGVVEITADAVPNPLAGEYARNNYTLEAMALFNQDDILSLEAPGAQVQLIGNLRAVLFLALPGEEQHFTIRVGAEDFSFGGMTFLMVPATLSQLEEIAKLGERKDELEDDYHKLSGSLDDLLGAMGSMTGSLSAAAAGLDQLGRAQGIFSAGKGSLYDGTDALRGDLTDLAELLDPVAAQVQALSRTVTDSQEALNGIVDVTTSLKGQLKDVENALEDLEDGKDDLERLLKGAAGMKSSLRSLESALKKLGGSGSGGSVEPSTEVQATVQKVKEVHALYEESDKGTFLVKMLLLSGAVKDQAQAQTLVTAFVKAPTVPLEGMEAVWAKLTELSQLFDAKASKHLSFQKFCETITGDAALAKQMNDLWIIYDSGKLEEDGAETVLTASLVLNDPPDDAADGTGGDAGQDSSGDSGETGNSNDSNNSGSADGETGGADVGGDPGAGGGTDTDGPAEPPAEGGTGEGLDGDDGQTNEGPAGGAPDNGGADDSGAAGGKTDESGTVGGAAVDLIAGGLDSTATQLKGLQQQLTSILKNIGGPTAAVIGDLADLCDDLDDLTDLLDDADDLSAAVRRSSQKLREILDGVQDLQSILNRYEPTLQETLRTVEGLSVSAAKTTRDAESLVASTEDLLRRSGAELDPGTKKTLEGLAATLRRTADVMATSGSLLESKNAISGIIEDTWNEHTGDTDNLLMMDATAEAVSLTDRLNPSPQSVQVLIRTQEIQEAEEEPPETVRKAAESGGFWSRVAQMFKDFWNAVTGIFK